MRDIAITAEQWRALAPSEGRARALAAVTGVAGSAGLPAEGLVDSHLPLAELVAGLAAAHRARWQAMADLSPAVGLVPPFLVGVTGGVAAGKTVTSEVLEALIGATGTSVGLVSTDGFLLSNAELEQRRLADRKGYPESYDHPALIAFFDRLTAPDRAPDEPVAVPVYDHAAYDVTGAQAELDPGVAVVIVEGVNVLQPSPDAVVEREVADFLDLSIYLDASGEDVRAWFLHRLQRLRAETGDDPSSFFATFAGASDEEFLAMGAAVWAGVNEPNLVDHIAPCRDRADVVVIRGADHTVSEVRLRLA